MNGKYVYESFALGDLGEWVGLHDPRVRWNGFACPLFALDTCRQIAEVVNALPDNCERIDITDDGRVFSVWLEGDDGEEASEVLPVCIGGVDWFPLGSHGWVWCDCVSDDELSGVCTRCGEQSCGVCDECDEPMCACDCDDDESQEVK